MARKYDVEDLIDGLDTILKASLNTKIAALNAEKNDSITLADIPNEAYFFQDLKLQDVQAYDNFLLYGLGEPKIEAQGPYTAEIERLFYVIVVKDTAENSVYLKKLLRYRRILKEIFEENFTKNGLGGRLIVTSLAPVDYEVMGSGTTFRAVGVIVEAALA